MHSLSEENYLKAVYQLSLQRTRVSPVMLSEKLKVSAASVAHMLKKLIAKNFVFYEKKKGIYLTKNGYVIAIEIVRAHRLWECFLSKKLCYRWDQLHAIAEELEHIKAPELLERLERYLDHPCFDPHGDPIPSSDGSVNDSKKQTLSGVFPGNTARLIAVKTDAPDFLQYLEKLNIYIGSSIKIIERVDFDGSFLISCQGNSPVNISRSLADHLFIVPLKPREKF
ncbi:metal-dependent transcriptional regulator [Bacteroidetes bacterium endosymbiont of Geopemphigus sp.]|uniref:metal-dependent transcriptional regulator n=1 Tax=Bacteroidetes bacterium endosymbiont of Geopemphigus sp. TaxID=2047937 RepID=UPI000CD0A1BC|nr:metal-dependent transcriptional regulator [Bacteroidetes bacterium endosymbiont of Geopemphigus sp.]